MSEDGTAASQSDRLEADSLPVLPEFHSQEARKAQIAKLLDDPPQHGRLAAAGAPVMSRFVIPVVATGSDD
jgi:hypothetical protein